MADRIFNVMFICTGNSARSIIAEALLNYTGRGRFRAFSAGSFPAGAVHPLAVQTLAAMGLPIAACRSKSWSEFATPESPRMDFVFTVCDRAAGEICPVWPGEPITAHWGIEDPVVDDASSETMRQKFHDTALALKRRIDLLVALPIAALDRLALQRELNQIGKI